MDAITFLILALATWRISSLAVNESGPWQMLDRLREVVGLRNVEINGLSFKQPKNVVSEMLTCVWCTSVWVGAGIAAFYALTNGAAFWFCLPLALSAVAILVQEHI